jgi:hypothetical protein
MVVRPRMLTIVPGPRPLGLLRLLRLPLQR